MNLNCTLDIFFNNNFSAQKICYHKKSNLIVKHRRNFNGIGKASMKNLLHDNVILDLWEIQSCQLIDIII